MTMFAEPKTELLDMKQGCKCNFGWHKEINDARSKSHGTDLHTYSRKGKIIKSYNGKMLCDCICDCDHVAEVVISSHNELVNYYYCRVCYDVGDKSVDGIINKSEHHKKFIWSSHFFEYPTTGKIKNYLE